MKFSGGLKRAAFMLAPAARTIRWEREIVGGRMTIVD
jgi:hypothetical protein